MVHNMKILYFHIPYFHIRNCALFLHSILVLSFYIDVVLTLFIIIPQQCNAKHCMRTTENCFSNHVRIHFYGTLQGLPIRRRKGNCNKTLITQNQDEGEFIPFTVNAINTYYDSTTFPAYCELNRQICQQGRCKKFLNDRNRNESLQNINGVCVSMSITY